MWICPNVSRSHMYYTKGASPKPPRENKERCGKIHRHSNKVSTKHEGVEEVPSRAQLSDEWSQNDERRKQAMLRWSNRVYQVTRVDWKPHHDKGAHDNVEKRDTHHSRGQSQRPGITLNTNDSAERGPNVQSAYKQAETRTIPTCENTRHLKLQE